MICPLRPIAEDWYGLTFEGRAYFALVGVALVAAAGQREK
ncbi:hypothetical protein AK812_SmicGene48748, partial [Symbiodinium microadriaticum]